MSTLEKVKLQLGQTLQLGTRADRFSESTRLLGSLPELDSMAVVNVITALEAHFGIVVNDDEINADTFETLGTLAAFVDRKLQQGQGNSAQVS